MNKSRIVLAGVVALLVSMTIVSQAEAQRRDRGRDRGSRLGDGGKFGLLMRSDVRKELEIVDEQWDKIQEISREMREQMREMFSGIRELPEDERRERFNQMREKMSEMRADIEKRVEAELLPNQRDRLSQIYLQRRVQREGTSGALGNDAVAKALDLSDEQQKKIKEVAEQAQKDLQKKIEELRDEARKQILDVLTPEQRKQYDKMLGPKYDPRRNNDDAV